MEIKYLPGLVGKSNTERIDLSRQRNEPATLNYGREEGVRRLRSAASQPVGRSSRRAFVARGRTRGVGRYAPIILQPPTYGNLLFPSYTGSK